MDEKEPYSGMNFEEVDLEELRKMWMEQKQGGKTFYVDGSPVSYGGLLYDEERLMSY